MSAFEKLGIDEDFNPYYEEVGIKGPNKVQSKVIPKIIDGKSLICVAQTGTGKTLAYALPIIELIKRIEDEEGLNRKRGKPFAVIIAPTKELAIQIESVLKKVSHHVKFRVRSIVGGQRNKSVKSLKDSSFEVLVGTPNKVAQNLKKGDLSFDQLQYMVFDEADTLFEMGFRKDVEAVLKTVEYDQTMINFFSATLPESVEEFIDSQFKKVELEKVTFKETHKVQQKVDSFNIFVSPKEKNEMLKLFLEKTAQGRGIVFANQKNQVDEIAEFLDKNLPKIKYKVLHGDLEQKERLANHKDFVNKKAQILVATDVAARGIDIKDLKWIFNWGLPRAAEFYLHRCGRVGRAGRTGMVYNLVTHFDAKLISHINNSIKEQRDLDLDFIATDIKNVKKKAAKKKVEKKKTKRVKITKRTRF